MSAMMATVIHVLEQITATECKRAVSSGPLFSQSENSNRATTIAVRCAECCARAASGHRRDHHKPERFGS